MQEQATLQRQQLAPTVGAPAPGPVVLQAPAAHPMRQPNPEGMAALGSVIGNLLGHGIGSLVSIAVAGRRPPVQKDMEIPDATEGEALDQLKAEHARAAEALRAWNRKRHGVTLVFATFGSAAGAFVAADAAQARGAAVGAAIGTGAVKTVNVVMNPAIGLPGLGSGALGAYIGAKTSGAPR